MLLGYQYLKEHLKIMTVDLSKQKVVDAYRRAMQEMRFTANVGRLRNATIFFILEKAKEVIRFKGFCEYFVR